jgi:aspartate racemase
MTSSASAAGEPPHLHIGILAHSADGAALCFLEMVRRSAHRLGAHEHPEITLSIRPMGPTLPLYERNDLVAVRAEMALSATRLKDAGCDFFVCPDNTAHLALESEDPTTAPLPLPGLHIAEIVAVRARESGWRRVGLLGTRWTMEGAVYRHAFARQGLELRVPSAADRALVDRVIFEELTQGVLSEASRQEYVRVIAAFEREGCDAVALSCTEIPLLIPPEVSPLPTLDSTRLLADAAVRAAIERQVPSWRGGEVGGAKAGAPS